MSTHLGRTHCSPPTSTAEFTQTHTRAHTPTRSFPLWLPEHKRLISWPQPNRELEYSAVPISVSGDNSKHMHTTASTQANTPTHVGKSTKIYKYTHAHTQTGPFPSTHCLKMGIVCALLSLAHLSLYLHLLQYEQCISESYWLKSKVCP